MSKLHQSLLGSFALLRKALLVLAIGAPLFGCEDKVVSPDALFSEESLPDYSIATVTTDTAGGLDDLSTVQFHVRVQNTGGTDTLGSYVTMYVNGTYLSDVGFNGLAGGSDTTVTLVWEASAGTHEIRFGLDQPPSGSGQVEESDESNNTSTLALSVPYRDRTIVQQDSITFGQIPQAIKDDSLVVQLLDYLSTIGYPVSDSSATLKTRYDAEGIVSYITPLANFQMTGDTVSLLAIMRYPRNVQDTVTMPFVFEMADSTSYMLYDTRGGIEAFAGDSMSSFPPADFVKSLGPTSASSHCTEPWFWDCYVVLGVTELGCIAAVFATTPTVLGSAAILAGCFVALHAGSQGCQNALNDDPPVITTYGIISGSTGCTRCDGPDLITFDCRGHQASVKDDRGPDTPNFLTHHVFSPSCSGGSFTFQAVDCGGNIRSKTVTAREIVTRRQSNHSSCIHDQGGGSP